MVRDILVGLGVTVFFFGLLELGCRLIEPEVPSSKGTKQIFFINDNNRDNSFVVERDATLGYRLKQTGEADTYTDSSQKTYARKKPGDTFRIICIGGSTTFGTGADYALWSYPALLEYIFRISISGCDRRVEVINAGMMGYHSWHSRIRVETELDALSPDMYLVMDGVNDIASLQGIRDVNELKKERSLLTNLVAPMEQSPGLVTQLAGLLSHSALYRMAKAQLGKLHGQGNLDSLLEDFGYRDNMRILIEGRKAKGIDTVIVNYPWSVRQNVDPRAKRAKLPPHWELTHDTVGLYQFGRRAITADNKQVCAATGAGFADIQPLFDAMTERDGYYSLYSDPVHFTRRGNLFLAREIYQKLISVPSLAAFLKPCRLRELYTIDSDPALHALAIWGKGYRGQVCHAGVGVGASLDLENIRLEPDATEGMRAFTPADASSGPGILRLRLSQPLPDSKETVFYPRNCGTDDSVRITAVSADGTRRELFFLQKSYPDGQWMPLCSRYALPVGIPADVRDIDIELGGHAQLFTRHGSVLFQ